MKAAAPINLLSLPSFFHGRDARATALPTRGVICDFSHPNTALPTEPWTSNVSPWTLGLLHSGGDYL